MTDAWMPLHGLQCHQLSTAFALGGRQYPTGSWLVRGPNDTYSRALTAEEFEVFRQTGKEPEVTRG